MCHHDFLYMLQGYVYVFVFLCFLAWGWLYKKSHTCS